MRGLLELYFLDFSGIGFEQFLEQKLYPVSVKGLVGEEVLLDPEEVRWIALAKIHLNITRIVSNSFPSHHELQQ